MSTLVIETLELSQFRSHARARIEVGGGPVAIHGPNGAGKTNILEAISLLSPGRGLRRAAADAMIRSPANIGWRVRAEMTVRGMRHEIETFVEEPGAARQVRVDGKASPQVSLSRIARILWLVPAMDRLWIEGAGERRRFLDRMTMSLEPAHADAVLGYEKSMRERNRLLKDQVRDPGWYAALEGQMAEYGAQVMRNRRETLARLAQAQDAATGPFPAADLDVVDPDDSPAPEDEDALRETLSRGRHRDLAAGRTLIGPHRSDLAAIYRAKGMEARHCSTGEQKALLVSLILANARAVAQDFGAPPILLLDEISAHLDTDRRAALYDEIVALGAQAWLTGTGAELFTALGDRASWFEVTETGGVSTARAVDPAP